MHSGLIVFIAVIVVIAAAIAIARVQDQRYRSGLLGWAAARGWACRDANGLARESLPEAEWLSLLPKGRRRRGVKFQLDGARHGRPVTVAHYWYQTTHTNSSGGYLRTHTRTHNLTVIVARLAGRYPAIELRHRGLGLGWGLAVSRAVGWQPANLTGTEEFDRRYQIRTAAPGGVQVTPQLVSAYLTSKLPLWKVTGDQLIITWPEAIKVDNLDYKVDQALTIAGLLDTPETRP